MINIIITWITIENVGILLPVPMLWVLGITLLFEQTDDTHAEDVYGIPVKCANEGLTPSTAHYGYCYTTHPWHTLPTLHLKRFLNFLGSKHPSYKALVTPSYM